MSPASSLLAVGALIAITACGGSSADTTILVSAAASLTDAFAVIEDEFEANHPGTDVVLNLAGSASLREQLLEGAPVDVFASANESVMATVVAGGQAAQAPVVFAHNRLQIAVPRGNPGAVTGLSDFADDGLLIGLCAEGVPCGDLARQVLAAADIVPSVDTLETDVRSLLTKIEEGEIDAGIVYRSDVHGAGGTVEPVEVRVAGDFVAGYPIVVVEGAPNPGGASKFVDFVLSETGQRILVDHGFTP